MKEEKGYLHVQAVQRQVITTCIEIGLDPWGRGVLKFSLVCMCCGEFESGPVHYIPILGPIRTFLYQSLQFWTKFSQKLTIFSEVSLFYSSLAQVGNIFRKKKMIIHTKS